MMLEKFTLPKMDIRLIIVDSTVHKIKVSLVKEPNRNDASYEEFCSNPKIQEEIEKIITVLLTRKDDPQPIKTDNLTVYPYRKKWKIADKLLFYKDKRFLLTCPYVYSFYIEQRQKLSKKSITESEYQHKNTDQCSDTILCISTTQENNQNEGTIQVNNDTKHATYENQAGQIHGQSATQKRARTVNQVKSLEPQNDVEEKSQSQDKTAQSSTETRSTDEAKLCSQPVIYKYKPLFERAVSKYVDEDVVVLDESESKADQSVSMLDGMRPCNPESVSEDLVSEGLSSDEDEIFAPAKENLQEKPKLYKPITLIPASSQTRKRHGELLDEAEPKAKKKHYAVTEYLDANRHEVQEQDLQEQLRYQQLATPADEKPAFEERPSSLQRVISTVKRLMFG